MEKVPTALAQFFTDENLSTLRDLALREVASSVDHAREGATKRESPEASGVRSVDRLMVCLSSAPPLSRALLRKGSRIAGRLNTDWFFARTFRRPPNAPIASTPHSNHSLFVCSPVDRALLNESLAIVAQRLLTAQLAVLRIDGKELTIALPRTAV